MTHNEIRTHWFKEGAIGLGTGILYGLTSVVVGHPFDTVKTKMQAQEGFEKLSTFKTLSRVYKLDGIRGLYRGSIPPLWGSGLYRSIQFSGFEAVYTYLDNSFGRYEIPFTYGIQTRVIFGGLVAGSCRAVIETPLEYVKTHRQVGQNWHLKNVFTGFNITWMRSLFLLPSYFILLDSFRRHFQNVFGSPLVGPFLTGGVASIIAWTLIWPFEYARCQIQAGYLKNMTITQRFSFIIRERGGFIGLYRGLGPGLFRSFVANGSAMTVMQFAQRKVSEFGWRD